MRYKGKEKCSGCGKSGTESPRKDKNSLCDECMRQLERGRRAEIEESSCKYVFISQHVCAFRTDWLNTKVHEFLESVNNEHVDLRDTIGSDSLRVHFGDNKKYYKIDARLVDPLKNLFNDFNDKVVEIEEKENNMKEEAIRKANMERDRIFNEGVEYGKNLLFQLNRGEITANDFNKDVVKYSK